MSNAPAFKGDRPATSFGSTFGGTKVEDGRPPMEGREASILNVGNISDARQQMPDARFLVMPEIGLGKITDARCQTTDACLSLK